MADGVYERYAFVVVGDLSQARGGPLIVPLMTRDKFQRPLGSLRMSVTDRCNLRCHYCMPEEEYQWLDKQLILDFEELCRVARVFAKLGVDRIRLTGGEPLLRKDLPELVGLLRREATFRDIALTTNGLLLEAQGEALKHAGLDRLTVSLDSLDPARYARLTSRDKFSEAVRGIEFASGLGFRSIKINTVVVRGENDDELCGLLEFGRRVGAEVRFIEYMDVGGATRWQADRVVSRDEMLAVVGKGLGDPTPLDQGDAAPADRWRLPDGTTFGIISSTTSPFCSACDRSRLTADGTWYLCLYARSGVDLRSLLRSGITDEELLERIASGWRDRSDRGAEERLALHGRGALADVSELAADPHLEMHTRGG